LRQIKVGIPSQISAYDQQIGDGRDDIWQNYEHHKSPFMHFFSPFMLFVHFLPFFSQPQLGIIISLQWRKCPCRNDVENGQSKSGLKKEDENIILINKSA
jgi:hypothetical protein